MIMSVDFIECTVNVFAHTKIVHIFAEVHAYTYSHTDTLLAPILTYRPGLYCA